MVCSIHFCDICCNFLLCFCDTNRKKPIVKANGESDYPHLVIVIAATSCVWSCVKVI